MLFGFSNSLPFMLCNDFQCCAMPNKKVLTQLGLVPVSLALRMQRLKSMQEVVRRPLRNLQILGALFGESYWEGEERRNLDREGYRVGPVR